MFKKILIANRGEIAVRIIRTCREMGILSVAVCSDVDKNSLHAKLADEVICVGSGPAQHSYLNDYSILSAAIQKGVDSIHPGYGFLSENSEFAEMCEDCKIKFIGPSSNSIRLMGDKANSRKIMKENGIKVIKGFEGNISDLNGALNIAKLVGYPIMIKAVAGDEGSGIRVARNDIEFALEFNNCRAEANGCFGNDNVYIEKYIENAKHIEFQIVADDYGNAVHLGDRDCSIQRYGRKIFEESPSLLLDDDLRESMGRVAKKVAKVINYSGAGTIEFLIDENKQYYFMEMNTSIQVEHPVTEMVTSIDLIKEQINIASGEKLSINQENVKIVGHAIECRINAEDPQNNFMPSCGEISYLNLPGGMGIRIDSGVYQGYDIPHYYDSMIAKLIVHGKDRNEAINRMKRALGEFIVGGVKNNIDYQWNIINDVSFIQGNYNLQFLKEKLV